MFSPMPMANALPKSAWPWHGGGDGRAPCCFLAEGAAGTQTAARRKEGHFTDVHLAIIYHTLYPTAKLPRNWEIHEIANRTAGDGSALRSILCCPGSAGACRRQPIRCRRHGRSGSSERRRGTADAGQAQNAHPDQDQAIVVTGIKRSAGDILGGVSVVSAEELTREVRPSIGETLKDQPGVTASSFGPTASRPILRGLQGERVRVLVDGIGSLDLSSSDPDHAVAINPLTAERIEVLRGPPRCCSARPPWRSRQRHRHAHPAPPARGAGQDRRACCLRFGGG